MFIAIGLAIAAFAVAVVALCYDTVDQRFRLPFRDETTGAWRLPERPVQIILGIAFAIMLVAILKYVVDLTVGRRAAAEAALQWQRMRTLITAPEVVIIAEFPEAMLRERTAGDPAAAQVLDERLALVRQTPIPPDPCEGLLIARGVGAVSIVGDILARDGGLAPADFSMVLGFFKTGKDLTPFTRSGLDLFDMSMDLDASMAQVRLSFLPETRTFRLSLVGSGNNLDLDPEAITSTADFPTATAVLEPFTETNAFERGFVRNLMVRDPRSGANYGLPLTGIAATTAESGWPPHTLLGAIGPSEIACMPDLTSPE